MQKLSNGCMNLCVWACGIPKSKGQGAIGYRERVKCHRLRGALLCKQDHLTKSLKCARKDSACCLSQYLEMPSSTKCLYNEGGSADDANADDSICETRTSARATVRGEPIGPPLD